MNNLFKQYLTNKMSELNAVAIENEIDIELLDGFDTYKEIIGETKIPLFRLRNLKYTYSFLDFFKDYKKFINTEYIKLDENGKLNNASDSGIKTFIEEHFETYGEEPRLEWISKQIKDFTFDKTFQVSESTLSTKFKDQEQSSNAYELDELMLAGNENFRHGKNIFFTIPEVEEIFAISFTGAELYFGILN